jgi:rubrerythrin
MKPRPLWVAVWGLGRVWRGKVTARLSKAGRWVRVLPERSREVEATMATVAVRKALVAYGREEATCRKCGGTWERRRGTKRVRCPKCHNAKSQAIVP